MPHMKQNPITPRPLFIFSCLLLLCTCVSAEEDRIIRDTPESVVVPPAEADNFLEDENALDNRRNLEHLRDLAEGKNFVYVATIKDNNFGYNRDDITVLINDKEVSEVMLHITGDALTFVIPTDVVLNKNVREKSVLEIRVKGRLWQNKLPIAAIARQLRKVNLDELSFSRSPSAQRPSQNTSDNMDEDIDSPGSLSSAGDYPSEDDESVMIEKKHEDDYSRFASVIRNLHDSASEIEHVEALRKEANEGNSFAMANLAAIYLSGDYDGVPRDLPAAVQLLRTAASVGNADAQALLAFLHASGFARPLVPKNVGKALLMWEFAAKGGSLYAKLALAFRYFTGVDVAEDCEAAASLYEQVASNVLKQGSKRKRRKATVDEFSDIEPPMSSEITDASRSRLHDDMEPINSKNQKDVVQYYQHAARRGDTHAQVVIGNLYYYGGAGLPQDLQEARRQFQNAANGGFTDAHAHLGYMDLRAGRNISAYEHLTKAAENGSKMGHHGLGVMYMKGVGVDKNPKRALFHFEKAAQMKVPEAMYYLGAMYYDGEGVPRNLKKAIEFFKDAANHDHLKAHYMIGYMSWHGIVPASADCAAASRSFKLVAEQGIWNKILGRALAAYEKGQFSTALYRYLQAAHAGIEVSQFNAAYMYDRNQLANEPVVQVLAKPGQAKSLGSSNIDRPTAYQEALELYKMSASQGSSEGAPLSLLRMGDLVYREHEDFEMAASAYEKAGKFQNAEALFNLGVMHAFGRGRKADANMAKRFFDDAKLADPKAFLPTTIAVVVLRYSDTLRYAYDFAIGLWESYGLQKWAQTWLVEIEAVVGRVRKLHLSTDVVVLLSLLAALLFVVNARQRLQMAREELHID